MVAKLLGWCAAGVIVTTVLSSFADGRIFGERFGDAAPWALALHGWARDHKDFAAVLGSGRESGSAVEGSASGVDAIDAVAPDLPGFGATPPPPAPWGSPEYAAALAQVLDEMAPKVVLLGHSFGGRVAVHLAASRPERVAGLVLTGVPLYRRAGASTRPAARYRATRSLARSGLVSKARLEAARRRYGSADYLAAQGVMRDVLVRSIGESYGTTLAALSCPTVLVWGERDEEVPVEVARRAASAIAGSELEVVAGAGHLLPLTAPQALRAALVRLRP